MKDLNKIILIGRLGSTPVQRETKNGTPVTHFSLATSRWTLGDSVTEDGVPERSEETVWHSVVVWGRQAEACAKYLSKGRLVFVEGSIRKHPYTGKDGSNRIAFEVHADTVGFLDSARREKEVTAEVLDAEAS